MRKVLPILLILIGVGLFAFGVANAVGGVTSSLQTIGEPWSTPGMISEQLEPGTYVVYENMGFQGSRPGNVTVDPDSISVRGPNGAVTTTCISCGASSTTVTLGSVTYIGVVSFPADVAGRYTIVASGEGASLILGPSLTETLGGVFGWTGAAILGAFLAMIGLIWLIVAAVTGRPKPPPIAGIPYYHASGATATTPVPANDAQWSATATPAGSWYPDPEDPNQLRWWDGRQWTDDRRPR